VPSARRQTRFAVLGLCAAVITGGLAGCSTTQEKAAAQRAKSERILKAREKRQKKGRQQKLQPKHEKEKG